ncbi:MAG TPA: hypothetical protein VGK73_15510, partial [Polyangiaceae bacterium]
MSSRRRLERLAASACLLGAFGCGDARPAQEELAPSPAFPNRRGAFAADGRLLGYVANRFSDDVSVVDLDAMQELGRPS